MSLYVICDFDMSLLDFEFNHRAKVKVRDYLLKPTNVKLKRLLGLRETRPRRKREVRFRRCKLPYWLVHRCRRRPRHRPPRMDGSFFPSPRCRKHRRWKRGRNRSRAFFERTRLAKWSSGRSVPRPGLDGVSKTTRDSFCDDPRRDILQLSRLLSQFTNLDHAANASALIGRIGALRGVMENRVHQLSGHKDPRTMMLIWDTGASFGLTPFKSDFIDYVKCKIQVRDVTKSNTVIGIGTTLHKFKDSNGKDVFLPFVSYHLTSTDVQLFSPQTYHQMHGGKSVMDGEHVSMRLPGHTIDIEINREQANLPIVHDSFVSESEKRRIGPQVRSAMSFTRLATLDLFGDLSSSSQVRAEASMSLADETFDMEFEHWSNFCGTCVGSPSNQNLSGPERELLLWHWKLGVGMQRIQEFMRERTYEEPHGQRVVLPPIIKAKFPAARNCAIPACESCQLARARKRSAGTSKVKQLPEKESALTKDKMCSEVGDFVSTDQFICKTPGRLPTGYGREPDDRRFQGGTIYNDAASSAIWVENQVSLGANATVMGKQRFEEWLWEQARAEVSHYHADNGIFTADEYRRDCDEKGQSQSFSGVGAQHQNALAERSIQTIMYMARTFMVHSSLHWSERGADNISLWGFAVKHSVWLYNRLPNIESGITPLEFMTKSQSDHRDLLRCHVWGCPVFVLEEKLQNDKKLPKWNRRSRMGQFLGFSDQHSSLVANVRHLGTGYVSPQFHLVFDDLYETVVRTKDDDETIDSICNDLYGLNRDWYAEEEFDREGNSVYKPPPLHDVWLDEHDKSEELVRRRRQNEDRLRGRNRSIPDIIPATTRDEPSPSGPIISDDEQSLNSLPDDAPLSESEGDFGAGADDDDAVSPTPNNAPEGAPPSPPNTSPEGDTTPEDPPRRSYNKKVHPPPAWTRDDDGVLKRVDANFTADIGFMQRVALSKLNREMYACTLGKLDTPPEVRQLSKKKKRLNYKQYKCCLADDSRKSLNNMSVSEHCPTVAELLASPIAKYITLAANDCGYSGTAEELIVNHVHPLFLKAQSEASKEDNPRWKDAMGGDHADDYWKATKTEIATLESMGAWEVVERSDDMNVIDSTWAFKCKRYPDGLIKKFKARFCARGDQQLEGIDFFETYAPVVQWTTVRLMLILEVLLGLKSKQGDVTAAFLHADIGEDENVFVEMPAGFVKRDKNGTKKVLKLRKTLYGLRQSPRAFWKYMTEKLESCGMKQSDFDPCLFIGESVMCIMYVQLQ